MRYKVVMPQVRWKVYLHSRLETVKFEGNLSVSESFELSCHSVDEIRAIFPPIKSVFQ